MFVTKKKKFCNVVDSMTIFWPNVSCIHYPIRPKLFGRVLNSTKNVDCFPPNDYALAENTMH